jgi:hypothetical protein
LIWGNRETIYFFGKVWTGGIALIAKENFLFRRRLGTRTASLESPTMICGHGFRACAKRRIPE